MNTFSPGTILVQVGTKRGLFLLTSRDRKTWEVEATALKGRRIFYATLDQRSGHRLFAAENGDFFGSFLRYSDDFGLTWHEPEQGIQFPEASQQKLSNIWVIEPGRVNEPGTVYVGVDPASLWGSNAGDEWIDIQRDFPSEFGFAIALDIHNPDTVYVIVEEPDGRNNVSEQFTVYRTEDGGERWEPLTEGLPAGPGVRLGVLRHAMCTDSLDPCGVFVGTNTGQLFASNNRGDNWHLVADFLPPIYSVKATMLV